MIPKFLAPLSLAHAESQGFKEIHPEASSEELVKSADSKAETDRDCLLNDALSGDSQAAQRILLDVFPSLFRYVRGRVASVHIAEDITQEVLIRIYKHMFLNKTLSGKMSDYKHFLVYLFKTAKHVIIDYHRNNRRIEIPLSDEISYEYSSEIFLSEAIDRLSDLDKDLLLLKTAGFTFEEISNITSKTPEALRKRYSRALYRLREFMIEPE